ncbi:MAG: hypothetical protein AAF711_10295 [Planctomycetota bacterium]
MGPYTTELVHAREFEETVALLLKRSGMYVQHENYHAVTAFILGMDQGELIGLHQWLVVKLDGFNNIRWDASIPELSVKSIWPINSEEDHQKAIKLLGATLSEFFEYRRKVGLTKIFYDYANWLLKQDWYDGPLREQQ